MSENLSGSGRLNEMKDKNGYRKGYTVLFQGDSITDGGRGRTEDLNHILGHSYPYLVSSRLGADLADRGIRFVNRGISGHRVSDLYARWNEDAFAIRPDLISILVGVNDLGRRMGGEPSGVTDRFERAYRNLLEETKEVLPNARLVLCEPFILKVGHTLERWVEWQSALSIYKAKVRELAERTGPEYWIWDGVHPTAAGHQLIADQWLRVVQKEVAELRR